MEKWFEENRELLIKELKFKEIIDNQNKMYLEYIEKKILWQCIFEEAIL